MIPTPKDNPMTQNDEAERLARDCELAANRLKDFGAFEAGQSILTDAAALIRTQAARIAELEGERDEYAAHVVEFSETAAELIEEMSKRPQSTWGQVKAAVRALGDIGDRRAYGKIKTRAEAAEAQIAEAKDYAETCNRLMRKAQGDHEAAEAEVVRLKKAQTKAATDILAERQRQIGAEGWTPEHDDAHMFGEMATAASSYAAAAGVEAPLRDLIERGKSFPENWPWSKDWWKPTTRRRDLVKAGALIIAEIERLDRAALAALEGGDG